MHFDHYQIRELISANELRIEHVKKVTKETDAFLAAERYALATSVRILLTAPADSIYHRLGVASF
jgi:hypothetical protein